MQPPAPSGQSAGRTDAPGGPPSGRFGEERSPDQSKWTRTSRTYERADSIFETEIFTTPVNFKDGEGAWRAIDNTLVPVAGRAGWYGNKANSYEVHLPPTLASPVRFQEGREWVSLRLKDASGRRTIEDSTARYDEVRPGVRVDYAARGDSLKEAVVLADPSAASALIYDVRTSPGLSARETPAGGVVFVTSEGRHVFGLSPSYAFDSSDNDEGFTTDVTTTVEETNAGSIVTVEVDPAWLTAADREWPVTIDPTVYSLPFGADGDSWGGENPSRGYGTDCRIVGAPLPQLSSFCTDSRPLAVGWDGLRKRRTLLKFDVADAFDFPVYWKAQILHAELGLYLESATTAAVSPVSARAVTEAWTNDATWEKRTVAANWSSPGATYDASSGVQHPGIGSAPGWYHWYPTRLVQNWVDNDRANHGIVLKQPDENVDNILRFGSSEAGAGRSPSLRLYHTAFGQGERSSHTYEEIQLNSRLSASVNVGSGFLELESNQLSIKGTGLDLVLDQRILPGGSALYRTGRDVGLLLFDDGSAAFRAPGGADYLFLKNADGSFEPPLDLNADLVKNPDGSYTLKLRGSDQRYNFSSGGYLTSQADRNGNRLVFNYNDSNSDAPYLNNRLVSIVDSQGRVTTFTHTDEGRINSVTDSTGRTYRYGFHAFERCIQTIQDPHNANPTRFEYSPREELGGECDELSKVTDPGGNVTQFTYDSLYRIRTLRRVNSPATGTGDEWTFTYGSGQTTVTDPRQNATTYHFNPHYRVSKVVDARGNPTSKTYTAHGNTESLTDGASAQTKLAWTPQGNGENLTSVTVPTSGSVGSEDVTTLKYDDIDAPHQPSKSTTGQGSAHNYDYDAKGNLLSVTYDKNGIEQKPWFNYTYNANGTLSSTTDGKRNITTYGYDSKGNLTGILRPTPLDLESFTYDALSRIRTHTNGNGRTTTYDYDSLDRPTRISYHDGSSVSYTYDANGNVLTSSDSTGLTRFAYDQQNRVKTKTFPDGTTATYAYDPAGNLSSVTQGAITIMYQHNAVNDVTTITDPSGSTTVTYDPKVNRRDVTTFPNGVALDRDFDRAGRLKVITGKSPSGAVLTKYTYTYTKLGSSKETNLRHAVTDASGNKTEYLYDELDRLTKATARTPGGALLSNFEYTYDANGNRLSQIANGVQTNYGYNAANQLKTVGATTYNYDANGNLTGNTAGLSFSYDAKNHTTSVTPSGGTALPMTYAGPSQDQRVTAGPASFTYSLGHLNTERTAAGASSYIRDDSGALVGQRAPGGASYYYLLDGLGSIVGVTNQAGALVGGGTYKYDPYGKELANPLAGTGVINPWGFAAGYYDRGTGLVKFGTRYYDPALARWTQRDPSSGTLTNPLGGNAYAYVEGNPVSQTDTTGRAPQLDKLEQYCNRYVVDCLREAEASDKYVLPIVKKIQETWSDVNNAIRSGTGKTLTRHAKDFIKTFCDIAPRPC